MGLTDKQAEEISVEDLSKLIVAELQKREAMSGATLQQYTSYYPWSLGGIEEDIYASRNRHDANTYAQQEVRRKLAEKFAQARQLLFNTGLIYRDPTQSSEAFARLTEKGKAVDVSAPIFGVTSTSGFIASIQGADQVLDAVVEGYLRESYSAAERGLWLSATFMLGAASERLLFVAADQIDALLKDPNESAKLAKLWKAREVKEWIVGHLPALKKMYAAHRDAFTNESGHPRETMPILNPPQVKAMLLGFGTYQSRISAILAVQP